MNERVVVISDIHLSQPPVPLMMRHADRLAAFIGALPGRAEDGRRVHLMVAGDFVDFLALEPFEAFTRDPAVACAKLRHALGGDNRAVMDALAGAMRAGVTLTVMAGNHDLELAHPAVQRAFVELLGNVPADPEFVVHGEAWRRGGLLVEHGNRYDGANENDWDGMRELVSSQSRGDTLHAQDTFRFGELVTPSAGSRLVADVLNTIRDRYPFVPLLQPEGVLTALLLRVLEPALGADWKKLATLFQAQQATGRTGPSAPRNIAAVGDDLDAELDAAFPEQYRALVQPGGVRDIAFGDWVKLFASERDDSVGRLLRQGKPLPSESLWRLQLLLRRLQAHETTFTAAGDPGPLGAAAKLMVGRNGIQTVVMGHTHLARSVGQGAVASYINTGTWTDMVRVPPAALADADAGRDALGVFLGQLCRDEAGARTFEPGYAEIDLDDGVVVVSRLGFDR